MEVGMDPSKPLGSRDALILVDVQQDFCPGGSLPIEQGHDVVPILNRWIEDAVGSGKNLGRYAASWIAC
jgi:nicotinamidase/pyrazinamidase